ncbi:MAG: hypothetical protein GY822_18245 [Deltaproteobacteria bacterium]|nr:hypothetical protein [Deltaproteobacteria bacterium]
MKVYFLVGFLMSATSFLVCSQPASVGSFEIRAAQIADPASEVSEFEKEVPAKSVDSPIIG